MTLHVRVVNLRLTGPTCNARQARHIEDFDTWDWDTSRKLVSTVCSDDLLIPLCSDVATRFYPTRNANQAVAYVSGPIAASGDLEHAMLLSQAR